MIRWTPRAEPLPIGGCVARGRAASALSARLLRLDDAALGRLEGVGARGVLAVFGAAAELPWVDGATWLGQVADAPALWLPTHLDPGVPADWLQRAVLRRTAGVGPVVVVPDALVLAAALPVDRAHLTRWA